MEIRKFVIDDVKPIRGDCARLWFDIETVKEPVSPEDRPDDWPDNLPGCPLKKRMRTFMIAVGYVEYEKLVFEVAATNDEAALLEWFTNVAAGGCEVAYASHNDFDFYVLNGRWSTARRRRLARSGPWPSLPEDFPYDWVNLWRVGGFKDVPRLERGEEIEGVAILSEWPDGDVDGIFVHCLRDVVEPVLADPDYEWSEEVRNKLLSLMVEEIDWA